MGARPTAALEFAVAAGCLKHSIRGDVNLVSRGRGRGAGRRNRRRAGRAMSALAPPGGPRSPSSRPASCRCSIATMPSVPVRITAALAERRCPGHRVHGSRPERLPGLRRAGGRRRPATTRTPSSAPGRSATRTPPTGSSPRERGSSSARLRRRMSPALCNRRRVPYLPGCATPTEIVTAERVGVEFVKVFPGDSLGPASSARSAGRCPRRRSSSPAAWPPPKPASASGSAPAPPASGSGRPSSSKAHTDPAPTSTRARPDASRRAPHRPRRRRACGRPSRRAPAKESQP